MKKKNRFNRLILAPFIMLATLVSHMARIWRIVSHGFREESQYASELTNAVRNIDPNHTPSFEEILERWGLARHDIEREVMHLRINITCLWFMVIIGGCFVYAGGFLYSLTGLIIIGASLVQIATLRWRKKILETRQFTPFAARFWR